MSERGCLPNKLEVPNSAELFSFVLFASWKATGKGWRRKMHIPAPKDLANKTSQFLLSLPAEVLVARTC